jgi:hypothetical protein
MTLAIVLIIAAILALVFIVRVSISRSLRVSHHTQPSGQIQPIDIQAFRNLVDPGEAEYLRRYLPPAEFRLVQRERLRAMAAYIQVAARNAAILILMGENVLAASDPPMVEAARQMVDQALLLRRNAAFALFRIYLALAWPSVGLAAVPVLRGYERLNGSAMLLGRLQNPAAPVRISATT